MTEMNNKEFASNYFAVLNDALNRINPDKLDEAIELIVKTYENDGTVFICGNGGSAGTASHIVCDFNKGVCYNLDKKFRFYCLNDNIPSMLAIANDCGYDLVFKMQLEGRVTSNDLLIGISGSGNSKNVLLAAEYAQSCGCKVLSLTGYTGGKLSELADVDVNTPIKDMQKSEDAHMIILHMIAQRISLRYGYSLC